MKWIVLGFQGFIVALVLASAIFVIIYFGWFSG